LSDDIAYIEAQGQGLQVQTANQKLLVTELQDILETIELNESDIQQLYNGNIITLEGLEVVERSALSLYKALVLTDPSLRPNASAEHLSEHAQLSKMKALREKRTEFMEHGAKFIDRFKNYMEIAYGQVALDIEEAVRADPNSKTVMSLKSVTVGRSSIWKYSPLVLFTKSLDEQAWMRLVNSYQMKMMSLYSHSISSSFQTCKKLARVMSGEEQELLFTMTEAQAETLGLNTRKMTVKRNTTLSRTFRASSSEKAGRRSGAGQMYPCEAVAEAIVEIVPLIRGEQTFIVDFFHASTTETMDFMEVAMSQVPEQRQGPLDITRKPIEPDKDMAQFISNTMGEVFAFLPGELQKLVDWATSMGPIQGIGILYALHKVMVQVDDGFFFRTLHGLATRLTNDWTKFINQQVRSIEETKVKIKKRKGVIFFMRVFPNFSTHVENLLPQADDKVQSNATTRKLVDDGYTLIIKAMFESLRVIAKESPGAAQHGGPADPEDKEALNYHILLIENMNHYVEHVDERGNAALAEGKKKARSDLDEHLSLYVDAVIRRPLGKIMVRAFYSL